MSTETNGGRKLRRREAIAAAGTLGLGAGAAVLLKTGENGDAATITAKKAARRAGGQCTLTPELTEGPYYLDDALVRKNVREGLPGAKLELRFKVEDAASCKPIKGAIVEIWHASAVGDYSGFGGGAADPTFLRGQQKADKDGKVVFKTIFPGWYTGRTTHIHVKVHVGGTTVHTGQLFFSDAFAAKVFNTGVYADRGQPDTTNQNDSIYPGPESEARVRKSKDGKGYIGKMTLVVKA